MTETKEKLLAAALSYRTMNLSVIPVGSNKRAVIEWKEFQTRLPREEEIREWFNNPSAKGIAIVTGVISGLVVVDTEAEADISEMDFGTTVESISGGGGRHFYYKYPNSRVIGNRAGIRPKIDIRGEGGYVIVPPSLHPSGGQYKWAKSIEDNAPAELPKWLLEELTQNPTAKALISTPVLEGRRNDTATRYVGKLLTQYKRDEWETIVWEKLKDWNRTEVTPPLDEKELRSILDSISSKEARNRKEDSKEQKESKDSTATMLIKCLEDENATLFHDQHGEPYIRVHDGKRWICRQTGSQDFKYWLCHLFYKQKGKAVGTQALSDAINLISAKSRFEGEEIRLENRVIHKNDTIWYNLCDKEGRVMKITAEKCEVIDNPPILFKDFKHQKEQIISDYPCDLNEIFKFIRIKNKEHKILLLVYLVSSLIPSIPHPIPVLYGPQGSSKTTVSRILTRLIDPSHTEVLSLPRNDNELIQQLSHNYAAFYDNIQKIPDNISDILCRAVTGEGGSKRKLFTDDEDILYSYRRTIGLNGINIVATKPDLLDRCILIELDRIPNDERKTENQLWESFEEVRPLLFRKMTEILSRAMGTYKGVELKTSPRMADFAQWGVAITEALGLNADDFLNAYDNNIKQQNQEVIDENVVANAIVGLMSDRGEWSGTASELLDELTELAEKLKINTKDKAWPKAANSLSRKLNEIGPNLKEIGINVFKDKKKERKITITHNIAETVSTVANAVPQPERDPSVLALSEAIKREALSVVDDIDDKDDMFGFSNKIRAFMDDKIEIGELNEKETLSVVQSLFGKDSHYIN